jgi:hypothetical protein
MVSILSSHARQIFGNLARWGAGQFLGRNAGLLEAKRFLIELASAAGQFLGV